MNNADFWNRVKSQLSACRSNQIELAQKAGVSIGVMRNWIYRAILPDAEKAYLIARSLNTTVEYLVTGETPATADRSRLLALLKEATQEAEKL